MEGPALGKNINVFSPPAACMALSDTMKAGQQCLLWTRSLLIQLDWVARNPQGSFYFYLPSTGMEDRVIHVQVLFEICVLSI